MSDSDRHSKDDQANDAEGPQAAGKLGVAGDDPSCVPVFNCVVYVGRQPGAGVRARVANLAGLQCTAGDERAAIGQLVKSFKQHLADTLERGEKPAWIEPVPEPEANEQTRWIPVHL